jgi:hypothetical protein
LSISNADLKRAGLVLSGMAMTRPVGIFPELDIQHPMRAILNSPMTSDRVGKELMRSIAGRNAVIPPQP